MRNDPADPEPAVSDRGVRDQEGIQMMRFLHFGVVCAEATVGNHRLDRFQITRLVNCLEGEIQRVEEQCGFKNSGIRYEIILPPKISSGMRS